MFTRSKEHYTDSSVFEFYESDTFVGNVCNFCKVSNLQNWQFCAKCRWNSSKVLCTLFILFYSTSHFLFTRFQFSRASEELELLLEIQQNPTSFFKWMEKSLIHVAFRQNGVKSFPTEHFSFSSICVFTKISFGKRCLSF